MQTTRRRHGQNALALVGSPPSAPPPPMRLVKNTNQAFHAPPQEVDPKWLEDAVLRIMKKHALVPPPEESAEIHFDFMEPSVFSRVWRVTRTVVILGLIAGAAGFAARWKYPAQTARAVASARAFVVQLNPHRPLLPPPVEAATVAPAASPTIPPVSDPVPIPPVPPAAIAPAPSAPVPSKPIPTIGVTSLPTAAPVAATPHAPKAVEPKPVAHTAATPYRPAPAPAPAPAPIATPAPETPAVPGSLGDAIRRAGGSAAANAMMPAATRASAAPEAKPASDPALLPERPSGSLVQAAILAALPEARACLDVGEETRAVVVFGSSGTVSSVEVSGPAAGCIQKALGHAHVPAFSQATYRAGVPIRGS
jgi:hypothetical protein